MAQELENSGLHIFCVSKTNVIHVSCPHSLPHLRLTTSTSSLSPHLIYLSYLSDSLTLTHKPFGPRSILTVRCSTAEWRINTNPISHRFMSPIDNLHIIHMTMVSVMIRDECRKSNELSVCHRLLSIFVIARASLSTDQRMSGLPIRAQHRHFKTICEHTLDSAPTVPSSSSLKLWSSKQGVENFVLYNCSSSQYRSTHFFACPSIPCDHATVFA